MIKAHFRTITLTFAIAMSDAECAGRATRSIYLEICQESLLSHIHGSQGGWKHELGNRILEFLDNKHDNI